MISLPQDFMIRMQDMLGEAYPAFLCSYEEKKVQALRVNTLKGTCEEFLKKVSYADLRPVAWEQNGFYYRSEDSGFTPGRHPFHEAGVYYIQEPSAMAPAAYLEAKPGERVLDLCAAPGGKTTQIASYMKNEGILVCNEIHPARAKILSENVERMGIRNALVTNETPQRLAEVFGDYFDRILVDAPCSGEGMFRKNEEACGEWSLENVQLCADRQDEILDCADAMLRPGGRLVYATCTFAPAENEGSIARFLERHPEYQIVAVPKCDGMAEGVPKWAFYGADCDHGRVATDCGNGCDNGHLSGGGNAQSDRDMTKKEGSGALKHTIRLFPHQVKGEGHYLAVLQKQGEVPDGYHSLPQNGLQKGIHAKEVKEFLQFQQETLNGNLVEDAECCLLKFGDQLYRMPDDMPSIKGLKVLRAGLHLGTLKKNRFEPSHALALALTGEDARQSMELGSDENARAYLGGMTLNHSGEKGWYLMTYQGYSIGWGKLAGQVMKNHYPRGLRKV
ncbi:MAG: RsmB/NOP family class I SAM-dependent RNA methyltransferase [Lachnospiraceae bacterium]|nr:RsmB/NOP family class I SAM-dependent RNA methyltransferase [Lachnospiraceae bacterium]